MNIPIEKKFHMLSQIQRMSHFEWLKTAMHFAKEGTTELDVVKKFWETVGHDTVPGYLKHIDPDKPLPRQIAENFVFSSQSMGEDAVLVEGKKGTRWQGRTRTDRLVFFDSIDDCRGKLVKVKITHTSPWSLRGKPEIHE